MPPSLSTTSRLVQEPGTKTWLLAAGLLLSLLWVGHLVHPVAAHSPRLSHAPATPTPCPTKQVLTAAW